MRYKNFVLISLFILILLNLVSSVPPVTTVQEYPEGALLVEQQLQDIKAGRDYYYHFFVVNSSSGKEFSNSSFNCTFFIASSNGSVANYTNAVYKGIYWEVKIDKKFLTKGYAPYGLYCSNGVAGSLSGTFNLTPSLTIYLIMFLFLIGGMFLFNYSKKEKIKISGDWDLFKMFGESVKEFKFFINWILIVLILCLITNFFYLYEYNILYTVFRLSFYLSMLVLIPVVIIFLLKFLDVRKRCNELANLTSWGER